MIICHQLQEQNVNYKTKSQIIFETCIAFYVSVSTASTISISSMSFLILFGFTIGA